MTTIGDTPAPPFEPSRPIPTGWPFASLWNVYHRNGFDLVDRGNLWILKRSGRMWLLVANPRQPGTVLFYELVDGEWAEPTRMTAEVLAAHPLSPVGEG